MTRKEVIEQVLARVPEEKKEAFVREVAECKDLAEKMSVLEKYGIQLTDEELDAFRSNKVSDEEIDEAAGGCCGGGHRCHGPDPQVF